jgi:hypothetical protein
MTGVEVSLHVIYGSVVREITHHIAQPNFIPQLPEVVVLGYRCLYANRRLSREREDITISRIRRLGDRGSCCTVTERLVTLRRNAVVHSAPVTCYINAALSVAATTAELYVRKAGSTHQIANCVFEFCICQVAERQTLLERPSGRLTHAIDSAGIQSPGMALSCLRRTVLRSGSATEVALCFLSSLLSI